MPHETATVSAVLLKEDQLFVERVTQMCRTRAEFLLACRHHTPRDVYEPAGEVLVRLEGRFITVQEIYEACAAHGWNRSVYEAWASETARRVRAQMRAVDEIASEALRLFAGDVLDTTPEAAIEAVDEAYVALYGSPWEIAYEPY